MYSHHTFYRSVYLYRWCLGRPAHSLDAIPASVAYLAPSRPGHRSAGHIGLGSPDEQLCPHCWLCGGLPGMLHCSAEQTSESAAGSGLHRLIGRICCLPPIAEFSQALQGRVPFIVPWLISNISSNLHAHMSLV